MRNKSIFIFSWFFFFIVAFTPMKETKTTLAGIKMQDFVIDISKYARSINPNFILIPQNGPELAFEKMNPDSKLKNNYLDAIDGIAVEELFYDKKPKVDAYRLNMLRKLKEKKQILLSDFILKVEDIESVKLQSEKEGFLLYPRVKTNQHYREIPTNIPNENADDILKLSDAKNYLYLINPIDLRTKHMYLTAIAETNYDVIAIDLFYNERILTATEVAKLKTKANGGKRLIVSYINIGAAEKWRYYWKKNWKLNNPIWLKKKYPGYDDEFFVQFWHEDWKKIIYGSPNSYIKKIIDAGFDGAFLDNVEAYYFLYNK